jgi:hypothetical protein
VHAVLDGLISQKEELEKNLQEKYGQPWLAMLIVYGLLNTFFTDSPSLTLRSSTQLGMFVHLSRARRDKKKLDEDSMFYCVGETLSTKSYFHRVSSPAFYDLQLLIAC